MKTISYSISYAFLYLLSLLPFWIIYRISDFLYILVYHVVGYRKKVVISNLKNSFPDKSNDEIHDIAKKFYSFFCDWIVEMIKSISIRKKEMIKRCHFTDKSLLEKMAAENKKVIFVMGHFGNYEMALAEVNFNTKYTLHSIYKPLKNKSFDKILQQKRTRFNAKVMPMAATFKTMVSLRNNTQLDATVFIADQTPSPQNAYWTTFLNQDTPVFTGTEVIAKKLGYPVIYVSLNRYKRGHYAMTMDLITDNPKKTKDGEISELHTKRLEKDIIRQPEIWLWSHKRWKHKRN